MHPSVQMLYNRDELKCYHIHRFTDPCVIFLKHYTDLRQRGVCNKMSGMKKVPDEQNLYHYDPRVLTAKVIRRFLHHSQRMASTHSHVMAVHNAGSIVNRSQLDYTILQYSVKP